MEDYYLNDFHRKSSEASQKAVADMLLHPYSREEAIAQVRRIKSGTTSKENANSERRNTTQHFVP